VVIKGAMVDGKSILVTGGSSGIGLGIVRYFAAQGCKIAIFDINAEASASVVASLKSEFPSSRFTFKTCDISNWDPQEVAFAEVFEEFGAIDVVIANAGVAEKGSFLEVTEKPRKPYLKTIDVNLAGTLYTVNLAIHYMRKNSSKQKGSIVCTASNAGIYPFPVGPMYGTSKHAVVGAVRSLARPLGPEGIQINALAPAVIQTGLADQNLWSSMTLTPMSTAIDAIRGFMDDPKLTGIIAEVHGNKVSFRAPPEYVDEDSRNNLETFWKLGYS